MSARGAPPDPDRLAGGLLGLLIGDALGVPYEFQPAQVLPPWAALELEPPPDFERSYASVPPGTWSDDGAQALCLLASLLEQRMLDLDDFAARLLRWHDEGYMAVDGVVFDCGMQTSRALAKLRAGAAPEESGGRGEHENGNGALMRVLPLVLFHTADDRHLAACAVRQALVTHGHPRTGLCCALYCLWGRRILEGAADPWGAAVAALRRLYADDPRARRELDGPLRLDEEVTPRGGGYVVDCLHAARHALRQERFEDVLKAAVALGDDTDTTAAVAGGLAGLRAGARAIPRRWRDGLRGAELYAPLLAELLEWRRAR